jgi:hypothetical protein
MSGYIAPTLTKTSVTATSTGLCTVDDSTVLYVGQRGIFSHSNQTSLKVYIIEIPSATTILCGAVSTLTDRNPLNNTGVDLSAYSGGSLFFPSQIVDNQLQS